tara:strand:- start:92372 stop:92884 length:513 start_codon:yes stop_codon:yes gene_type:complete
MKIFLGIVLSIFIHIVVFAFPWGSFMEEQPLLTVNQGNFGINIIIKANNKNKLQKSIKTKKVSHKQKSKKEMKSETFRPSKKGISTTKKESNVVMSPAYPSRSRRLGQEGVVKLSYSINEKGYVTNVMLDKSSGYDLLDESAIKTLKSAKFEEVGDNIIDRNIEFKFELQ